MDMTPKGQTIKEKNRQIGLENLKCKHGRTLSRMKRQPMGWEKICTNYISDKGLISRIYKELL